MNGNFKNSKHESMKDMNYQNQRLDADYQILLKEGMQKGEIREIQVGERRRSPRFKIDYGNIAIPVTRPYSVENVSKTGIAFLSTFPFQTGEPLLIRLENTNDLRGRVHSCEFVEGNDMFMEHFYRVVMEFQNPIHGKQAVVMLKEMDRLLHLHRNG